MSEPSVESRRSFESTGASALFVLLLAFSLWAITTGWSHASLPGNEFRQTQTAISAHFIQKENNFSLAYPTPVLGKPWSMPFEFPLYQWSTVWISNTTGLPLVQAGRLLSAVCFYLTLPAVWLMLGRMGTNRVQRMLVLGMVLTCPLYLFYSRAFLIETMALMFSWWFLCSFISAVERRSGAWLAVAVGAGVGAGLVKVTTFMIYLIPAGGWTLYWLWRDRPWAGGNWRSMGGTIGWVAAATLVPFAATAWWLKFAEKVRALNPSGRYFVSDEFFKFNFGPWGPRLTADVWLAHWRIQADGIVTASMLIAAGVLGLLFVGRQWRWIFGCGLLYLVAQAMFPFLYAFHDYYYVSIAILLMVAIGFVLGALFQSDRSRWAVWLVIAGIYGGQIVCFLGNYYQVQKATGGGGDGMTDLLGELTALDDVIVIAGDDWSSHTPYFAKRRALMILNKKAKEWDQLNQAFKAMEGETVAGLLLKGEERTNNELIALASERFGIETQPIAVVRDMTLYVVPRLRPVFTERLQKMPHRGVILVRPKRSEGASAAPAQEVAVAELEDGDRMFAQMVPRPDRVYSRFGLDTFDVNGVPFLNAHPDMRIWFKVPPGRRQVVFEYCIVPGAYLDITKSEATTGVEFNVQVVHADGTKDQIFSRILAPFDNEGDRGVQTSRLEIEARAGDELLVQTMPGPNGNYQRDWALWGPVTIK